MNERPPNAYGPNEHQPDDTSPRIRRDHPESEGTREAEHRWKPRIYVTKGPPLRAELTEGTWLYMARAPQEIYAEMYAVLGPEADSNADRYYIWDHRDFGAFDVKTGAIGLEDVHSVELLAQVARGIAEHGAVFVDSSSPCA